MITAQKDSEVKVWNSSHFKIVRPNELVHIHGEPDEAKLNEDEVLNGDMPVHDIPQEEIGPPYPEPGPAPLCK